MKNLELRRTKRLLLCAFLTSQFIILTSASAGPVPPFVSIFMRTVLDDPTALAARTTLGIGEGDSPTLAGLLITNLITEFSIDTTLSGNSNAALPTEKAVKSYVDAHGGAGGSSWTGTARLWKEMPGRGKKSGTSPPAEEFEAIGASGDIKLPNDAFDPTGAGADEEEFFNFRVPDDIEPNSKIQFFMNWFPDSAWGSGDYRWCIDYLVYDADLVYGPAVNRTAGAPTTIYEEVTPLNATNLIETAWRDPNLVTASAAQVILARLYLDKSESSADNDGHVYGLSARYIASSPGVFVGIRMVTELGDYMVTEYGAYMIIE